MLYVDPRFSPAVLSFACYKFVHAHIDVFYTCTLTLEEMFTLMSNNLDQDETPSYSAFHWDAICTFARNFELQMGLQYNTIQMSLFGNLSLHNM